jgi:hypothetical protein|tara:strand:+ start:3249 stop:3842 length:594 start_codon:yes stop_codon:yes gene_type:complete
MFSNELYIEIFTYLDCNVYYNIITLLNFNKNTDYFLLQMFNIYFDKINGLQKYKNKNCLKEHVEILLVLNYFNKHRHLEILNNYKKFNNYLKESEWAERLYNHDFTRVLNKRTEIVNYDDSIKENVSKIMAYMYFYKLIIKIECNQKNNNKSVSNDTVYISFYWLKEYLLCQSESLKEYLDEYISIQYPNYNLFIPY